MTVRVIAQNDFEDYVKGEIIESYHSLTADGAQRLVREMTDQYQEDGYDLIDEISIEIIDAPTQ